MAGVFDRTYTVDQPPLPPRNPRGLRSPGNINVFDRPIVPNPYEGGNPSTVFSTSFGTDDGEVLVPRVSDGADGRPPHVMSNREALGYYRKTGQNLGVFDTPDDATAYGRGLHDQQSKLGAFNGRTVLPQLIHSQPLERPMIQPVNMGSDQMPVFAPLSAPDVRPATPHNELGDPMAGRVNELGDAMPPTDEAPAPAAASPYDDQIAYARQRLQKFEHKQASPWGSPDNHPGKLGRIAHIFSEVGNIAGDIVAPQVMERIPGTERNTEAERESSGKELDDLLAAKGLDAEHAATTANLQSQADERPANDQSKRTLEGAQARNLDSEVDMRNNPRPEYADVPALIGPNGEPVSFEKHTGQFQYGNLTGAQQVKQGKPDTPEQQFIDEYGRLHPGSTVADAIRAYSQTARVQPQGPIVLIPSPQGGYNATSLHPGAHVGEGAVTPGGLSSMNVPTSATRTMVETAPRVIELADRAEQLINQQLSSLGPAASRWNEFMAGKVGAPNPEFTKLRTTVGLATTALMRMHVGARGGEQIMEHFQNLIDSSKQDPQNLIAAFEEIKNYAHAVQQEGNHGAAPTAASQPTAAPSTPNRPAGVPPQAQYITDPKTGKKGWAW